jgi:DNA topoisomerase-1
MTALSRDDRRLMKDSALVQGALNRMTVTRRPRGKGWSFHRPDGTAITDAATIDRLNALAVPPAYREVRYAANPKAHLQAIGLDAAGRLQYRYHPDWERVREARKAKRLLALAEVQPRLRRRVQRALTGEEPTRGFAAAACIALIMQTSIRAGGLASEETFGHRGATTLLKSNVRCEGGQIALSFRGKGGKDIARDARSAALCRALTVLRAIKGSAPTSPSSTTAARSLPPTGLSRPWARRCAAPRNIRWAVTCSRSCAPCPASISSSIAVRMGR